MFSDAERLAQLRTFAQLTSKLVRRKQQQAERGRPASGAASSAGPARLPPGQTVVRGPAPVVDLGTTPGIDPRDWRLEIAGAVRRPRKWSLDDLGRLPEAGVVSDIHCVTRWSRFGNRWRGVATGTLLDLAEPTAEARFAIVRSHDGYATNLPISVLREDDVLLATEWDGAPLAAEHGAPVRLVVPRRYFWKSAKWVRSIRLVATDAPGFWESRGYHNEGDPWREQRYR